MYNIINYQIIDKFIRDVFNYFNGRINKFQLARLDINWADIYSNHNGGTTSNPNTVTIYPKTIARYSVNKSNFMYMIILTVIHELYHVDQIILMSNMLYDKAYLNMIENTVEVQSLSYMANHINEINAVFNTNFYINNKAFVNYIDEYSDGNLYQRSRYNDHIIGLLDDIIREQEFFDNGTDDAIRLYLDDPQSVIIIYINNNSLILKDKDKLADINSVNQFTYENFFSYSMRYGVDVSINADSKNMHIYITTKDLKHLVCKKRRE